MTERSGTDPENRSPSGVGDAVPGASPYRRDSGDLLLQHRDALKRRLDALDRLEVERAETEELLKSAESQINRRNLSVLDQLKVASACPEDWESMEGDDRSRHCSLCRKTVHSLSSMTRLEAAAFATEHEGEDLCVTYFRRADGKIMTSDCGEGELRKKRRRRGTIVATAGAAVFVAAGSLVMVAPQALGGVRVDVAPQVFNAPAARAVQTPSSFEDLAADMEMRRGLRFGKVDLNQAGYAKFPAPEPVGELAGRAVDGGFDILVAGRLNLAMGPWLRSKFPGEIKEASVTPLGEASMLSVQFWNSPRAFQVERTGPSLIFWIQLSRFSDERDPGQPVPAGRGRRLPTACFRSYRTG